MQIRELKLKNFRCFEELTINFSTPYTVLIGINGSGKSSILDALRMILDTFVNAAGNDLRKSYLYVTKVKLQDSDAKIKTVIAGSTINKESQYPVVVNATVQIDDAKDISWTHELFSHSSMRSIDIKEIIDCARKLQNQIIILRAAQSSK